MVRGTLGQSSSLKTIMKSLGILRTQVLDKNMQVISDKEITQKVGHVRIIYACVKYFEYSGMLPKSEVLPVALEYQVKKRLS